MKTESNKKKAFLWNTASGLINAGQSAVILIFISHLLTKNAVGIFTIAYALGNLFSTMGKYGVRNFQVTDINEQYSFREYFNSRTLSSVGVMLLMIVYILFQLCTGKYTLIKSMTIVLICLWKMIDTAEDVFYGMYQQQGRLDVGARCYTIRLTISTVLFCLLLMFKSPLFVTSMTVLVVSIVSSLFIIMYTAPRFRQSHEIKNYMPSLSAADKELLKACFPLFLGTSLSIFVGNAPKYLIDWYLDDSTQAIFGYIMMPAFVIMVLNQFIYQPIIRDLGELWSSGRLNAFVRRVLKQYLIVGGITAVVIVAGVIVGIPILSVMYNTDLSAFRPEFAIILLGGGFYAIVSFIMVPLTAMRNQNVISYGFIAASILSLVLGRALILWKGVMGASVLYCLLNLILAMIFTFCFILFVNKRRREMNE